MYHVNDTVVYGTCGVCRITEITSRKFRGASTEYYVLKPVSDMNSTYFVPAHSDASAEKMRSVLSADEIYDILKATAKEAVFWIDDSNERKEKFQGVISGGDRMELVRLIKALHLHQQTLQAKGKRLHVADDRFLHEAEKMLYDEFAQVLHMERDDVLPFILEKIRSFEADAETAISKCS